MIPMTDLVPLFAFTPPTEEQKRMFDALEPEEQLKMLQAALIEGEQSEISDKSFNKIIEEAKREAGLL